jgi:GTP-binding protein
MSERTVAIVGRPNVGKSALFNRLARRRIAIVHDQPGVTRDRIHAVCKLGRAPFNIVDTGGIGGSVDLDFTSQVHAEVDIAIETADVVVFVVDGQAGINPVDEDLARKLRRSTKPLILAVNKIDHSGRENNVTDFAKLGFGESYPISAEHDLGIGALIEAVEVHLPAPAPVDEEQPDTGERALKIALVGRPNVGKSSLTNAILRDDRTLVSKIAGTTRDAVDIPYTREGKHYTLIDTAGIRHRSKVSASVEVFSVMRSQDSIKRADLCCLVIDASAGVTSMDKKIAGMIQEAQKPCVVAVNKWDLVLQQTKGEGKLNEFVEETERGLVAVSYAPFIMVSATESTDVTRLFRTFEKVRSSANKHIDTGPLNRALQQAMTAHPSALRHNKRFKVLYATNPRPERPDILPVPEIVLFCNEGRLLEDSYRRYLDKRIRELEPFYGLPILLRLRSREARDKKKKR